MTQPHLKKWDPNVICDICGFKFKKSQCKKTWDGYLACTKSGNNCWYPKHPFDDPLPVIYDPSPVHDARPEPRDIFITYGGLSIWGGAWISAATGTSIDPTWDQLTDLWGNY